VIVIPKKKVTTALKLANEMNEQFTIIGEVDKI
jgi:hypothetical protein